MVPEECTYTKEHEWVCQESGVAVIGISEYAAAELGDIVFVELSEPGSNVKQMDPIGTIEAVKTVAELFSPVSGEIVEVNEAIIEHPEIINRDPFEEGWFLKIKMSDPGELDNLFSYDEYTEFLGEQDD
ncbi:MAG TPA: glycine cleavage system protein GcvH [Candidatus Eisenbacteria bacterium]|uniref:Glycine cleavage system H protein n=1 Tax=Eiseniibacteriota bacterium TaxID=2212470 RepID=A0A7V2AVH7_UNCEI|nr:glycine cleavage system protein GcvH [Candidatus Eisenbacteria bacterium]